jgi:hypothetical protein
MKNKTTGQWRLEILAISSPAGLSNYIHTNEGCSYYLKMRGFKILIIDPVVCLRDLQSFG